MTKVSILDKRVFGRFLAFTSAVSATLSLVVIFIEIPPDHKHLLGWSFAGGLIACYLAIWTWANNLNKIDIRVEGSTVTVKAGDIFLESGLKAIPFNEYFDTLVDNKVIAEQSLNGIFVNNYVGANTTTLDTYIDNYGFQPGEVLTANSTRTSGKTIRYHIGTICVYGDYLLTAFAKFDGHNNATLTMPEYLEFLITFWDRVNVVYGQKSVTTPLFGSGITRIKGHKTITDEDLLKVMLWTFRISEMRFKHPAKLTIVIHPDKIDKINLLDIKAAINGL